MTTLPPPFSPVRCITAIPTWAPQAIPEGCWPASLTRTQKAHANSKASSPQGPPTMDTYHAFLKCQGRKATHRIEDDRASTTHPTHDCFTHDGDALLLCDSCFAFWRECMDAGDHTTWRFSLYLRNLPDPAVIHASRN